ncbi:unnamed protein product [Didymodactylos carnosus]|uniref:Choline/carnitine acyltransferase domain-containing protein n=1 Tax=Didymodactylos carnosus TaxID=1234261 RepID=A0A813UXT1_9BILA|nr:unnamed protein product [Didymodactylos carnosus]CAF1060064.1 unnamed protein product [Didymodactylos carnosus]CAF3619384.1 unnamed protein product [Didymodactylos carnosus]CAF3825656.1 unnamed protein product [Didymodactylos carnosus]
MLSKFQLHSKPLFLTRSLISVDGRSKHTEKHNDDDYNYFKHSILPTDHFQYSLPRLPIPTLDNTCKRYLAALKPLLLSKNENENDSKSYQQTSKYVEDFRVNQGKKLDDDLRQKNNLNRATSYISKPWFDMYLKSRLPLILNFNFFLVFNDDKRQQKPFARITNYIISSIRFMKTLRSNRLDPEVYHLNPKKTNTDSFRKYLRFVPKRFSFYGAYLMKAFPLDMSQYNRLFNSTRIPKQNCDILVTDIENIKHIIVIKGGHYYKVTVLDEQGHMLSPKNIASTMKYLCEEIVEKDNPFPLGYFTADVRDRWAMIREKLETNEHNKKIFDTIDHSIMLICLDEDSETDLNRNMTEKQRAEYAAKAYLCYNAKNRWFDKTFNMIMLSDGTLGLNCEHSWGDGVALMRFCNDIDKDATENPKLDSSSINQTSASRENIEKLEFQLTDEIKSELEQSKRNYEQFVGKFNVNVYKSNVIGKNSMKKSQLSPDSIMQLGLQLAYYKLYQKFVGTYESCSTAVFKHGRTETIRPVTMETREFIEKVEQKQANPEMLKKCSDKHQQLIKEAAMGQGFDRHLFALKYLQEVEKKEQLHPIYTDTSYQLINHNILSTSTVASKHIAAGGFGPVVNNGFGIGYLIDDDQCGLLVTSYHEKELKDFVDTAGESYKNINDIIKQ